MKIGSFAKSAVLMFVAMRMGDAVNLAAGMWFVPKYVSPEEIGAVLPLTSFATFVSLPVFAFAMTVMTESAGLAADGDKGRLKSLLTGVFAAVGAILAIVLAVTALAMPRFLEAMRVSSRSAGFLVVAAAFLGCAAPIYTDALQAMKRFRALGAIEFLGSVARLATMAVAMPARALAGYFAGQASLPVFRIAASVFALRRDLAVPAEPFWNRVAVRRVALSFLAILAYQAAPMFAALVEQSVLRTSSPSMDSAGYYIASRFSDFLNYMTFPLLLVLFPYTATAAKKGEDTRPYVLKCAAASLVAALAMAALYWFAGERLIALMPNGASYVEYAKFMPALVVIAALTSCQVFYTNAEVSAGRFGFLKWLVPLHLVYPAALYAAARCGCVADLKSVICWFAAASVARFLFSAASVANLHPRLCQANQRSGQTNDPPC